MNPGRLLPIWIGLLVIVLILTACDSSETDGAQVPPTEPAAPPTETASPPRSTVVRPTETTAPSPTALPSATPTELPPAYQIYTIGEDLGYSLNAADLNGDSYPDIMVADSGSDVIMLLFNQGDGTYQEPTEIATGEDPRGIDGADLDGDSHADLFVSHSPEDEAGKLSVLLNNGDGTFNKQVDYDTVDNWWGSPVDLDGDGDLDLVIEDATAKENQDGVLGVRVLLNDGDGTFQEGESYFSGLPNFASVHVADLDGDTYPDLAVRHYPDATISVLFGIGDGSFGEPVTIEGTRGMHGFIVTELNGDTYTDLAWVNYVGLVSVLINKGDGTFQERFDFDTGGDGFNIYAVDMDGDAALDLVVGPTASGMASLLTNNGDGTFQLTNDYYFPGAWVSLFIVSDVDGDGFPDLVGWDDNSVYVFPLGDSD